VPDLTRQEVEALLSSLGLPHAPGDLDEVTHRVNAFVSVLGSLGELPLEVIEPLSLDPDQP
jgi:hypothetical protein